MAEDEKYVYAMCDLSSYGINKDLSISKYDKQTMSLVKTEKVNQAFKNDKKTQFHSVQRSGKIY